ARRGNVVGLVVGGASARGRLLGGAGAGGGVVVSRLGREAALGGVPVPPRPGKPGKRGRKPIYGPNVISLAKRAAQARGWQTETFTLYGKTVTKTFKTFLATYAPAVGLIRVVWVRESSGWAA